MTVEEFKKLKPEYKDVEGDQLWDAMTEYMLRQQNASETIKVIMPLWKTHTLRWLYYRRVPNFVLHSNNDRWSPDKRCGACKKGVNSRMVLSLTQKDGTYKTVSYCPHCNENYISEPNTNFSHKLWKTYKWIASIFWLILDSLHLVRSSIHGRYDLFGDEARYVSAFTITKNGEYTNVRKKRRWWERIFIERPIHDF